MYGFHPYSKLAYSEDFRLVLSGGSGPTYTSSLSLINIPSISTSNGLGIEELDAIFVGKGQRT